MGKKGRNDAQPPKRKDGKLPQKLGKMVPVTQAEYYSTGSRRMQPHLSLISVAKVTSAIARYPMYTPYQERYDDLLQKDLRVVNNTQCMLMNFL